MSEYIVSVSGSKKQINFSGNSTIVIDGKQMHYELINLNTHTYKLRLGNKIFDISLEKLNSDELSLQIDGKHLSVTVRTSLQEKASKLISSGAQAHSEIEVKAPMPGMILKINKHAGDNVQVGEPLAILEAMKMENILKSPGSGKIKEIRANQGEPVEKNAVILVIE